jgi:ribonuclease HI
MSQGKLYEFGVLPNGLSSACRFFTKIGKIPLSVLRRDHSILCTGYLDDSLFVHTDPNKLLYHTDIAATLVQDLGFMISPKKSVIHQTQQIEYLGFIIDSHQMNITLPSENNDRIFQMVHNLFQKNTATIRAVAQVVGALIAARQATRHALLFTKEMENPKIEALRQHCGNFDRKMEITQSMKHELQWWLENLPTLEATILPPQIDVVMNTDASLKGWGAFLPASGLRFGGRWNEAEQNLHINQLELLAIYHALRAACREHNDCHIKIMTDNTTAVSAITKQGSTKSDGCNKIARDIWFWAVETNVSLTAAHIAGNKNVEADEESRLFNDNLEWTLNSKYFDQACAQWGTPTIDLFATRINTKLPRFCSWMPDPDAEIIDAFTVSWEGEYIYAFPPFSLLGKVIQKIIAE